MEASVEGSARARPWVAVAVVALAQAAVLLAIAWLPAALPADAPPAEFSATRALGVLDRLVPAPTPRPLGSPENAAFRDRLIAELAALGLAPETHEASVMTPRDTFARVRNVIATVPGTMPGAGIVLLEAHHDSVPAGPGVADDAAGVAALLEIARALLAERPARSVMLLFDDGEEAGLLGARAFVEAHPARDRVEAFVVLEARGTCGPSALWRLSTGDGGSAPLVRVAARALSRPVTSSALASLAARLPNDTDLTAFAAHGLRGFDLAFAEGLPRYHTPRDDRAALDPRTLQHHGQNALELTRALASDGLPAGAPGRDVAWTDVLGRGVLVLPAHAPWPWLRPALLLIAWIAAAGMLARGRAIRAAEIVRGALCLPIAALVAGGAGWLAWRGEAIVAGSSAAATAHPAASWAAALLLALAGAAGVAAVLSRGMSALGALAGASLGVILIAVGAGATDPGLAIVIEPAAWAGALALAGAAVARRFTRPLAALPLLVAAVAAFELAHALFIMSGTQLPLLAAIGPAVIAPWLLPFTAGAAAPPLARARAPLALLLAGLAALGLASALPSFTEDSPRHVTFVHLSDPDGAAAWWMAEPGDGDALPPAVLAAMPFEQRELTGWPGARGRALAAPADVLPLARPAIEVVDDTRDAATRTLRLRVTTSPDALDVTVLGGAGDATPAVIGGMPVSERARTSRRARLSGAFPEGVEVEFTGSPAAMEILVIERRPGLPEAGAALLAARPATATPVQDGDRTNVLVRARF